MLLMAKILMLNNAITWKRPLVISMLKYYINLTIIEVCSFRKK